MGAHGRLQAAVHGLDPEAEGGAERQVGAGPVGEGSLLADAPQISDERLGTALRSQVIDFQRFFSTAMPACRDFVGLNL